MKAIFVRRLEGFRGDARLYRLELGTKEARKRYKYVVVSRTHVPYSGDAETYIFAATAKGTVKDWTELDGSSKGEITHTEVLQKAGYGVVGEAIK